MGKGRIVSAEGEGLYTIELIEDRARANTERSLAVARVDALNDRLAELETELTAAQAAVDDAAAAQDQAILDYQAALADDEIDTAAAKEAMIEAGEALLEAAGARDAVAANIRRVKTDRLAAQRRIDLIDALPPLRQQQAWCADLTEDLAGEVGTAEVPGEATQVLVHPGHDGAAAYDVARDGALQPALSGTAASVYYNLAMLPGWQKWRPTYRIATIDAIQAGADTCDITLVAASSSQQGLNVNAEPSYAAVPIEYMTCHANAFEVGDRVLVRFDGQDHEQPKVIGFESQPRGCGIDTVVAVPVVLHFNYLQGFLAGSSCACGFTPTGAGPYTQYAVEDYAWNMVFDDMLVFTEGKLASALSADTVDDLPVEDEVATSEVERNSSHYVPTEYAYDFPVDDGGVCDTQTDHWSRVGVTLGTTFDGTPDTFFGGDVDVDAASYEEITLEDQTFQVSYTPALRRRHWESLEYGVFTTTDDGSECTAGYLLSKEPDPEAYNEAVFSIFFNNMPNLTIDGQVRRPLGLFHVVPGDPVYDGTGKQLSFSDGSSRIFSDRLNGVGYLLVGYGR